MANSIVSPAAHAVEQGVTTSTQINPEGLNTIEHERFVITKSLLQLGPRVGTIT